MTQQFCWTADRHQVLDNLVRRHAFDFGAASQAFQEYLRNGGVEFAVEEMNPKCLRKVFAGLDRKRATNSSAPVPASAYLHGTSIQHTVRTPQSQSLTNLDDRKLFLDANKPKMEFMKGSASASKVAKLFNPVKNHEVDIRNQTDYTKDRHEVKKHVYEYMNITESMPSARLDERESDTTKWTFDAFGREQEEQQQQHEARKERIFQNVLTALGCSAESRVALANELPPDVLRAWKTRADDKILVEARARDYNRKREEDRELALQRERLKNRNVPGGEDSVGDDPLAESTKLQQSTVRTIDFADAAFLSSRDSFKLASPGGVTLELGMDAEELDKLLSELEEKAGTTTGSVGTNSELSQVLDILDKSAGDPHPMHPIPSRVENGGAANDPSAGRSVAPPS